MTTSMLIGREQEKRVLLESFDSRQSEFVAVYGRRRVGKTFLIKETFDNTFDFYYTGIYQLGKKEQIKEFLRSLPTKQKASTWFDVFSLLKEYLLSLNKEKVTVFLDELPWLDSPKSNFLQAFSNFWNMWDSGNPQKVVLKLYVCGSATTWMTGKLIADKGGLYGRLTKTIKLKPFTLAECEEYLEKCKEYHFDRSEILQLYMIFGGIPYYLSMLRGELSVAKNVDELVFAETAPLYAEYGFLYKSLFKDSRKYEEVVELLSSKLKGLTREEIRRATNIEGRVLTEILDNLVNCDFVRKQNEPGKTKKDAHYQLTDLYTLFFLRFAKNNHQDEAFWSNAILTPKWNTWSGYAFEKVCFLHLRQVKKKLGIEGVTSKDYAWQQTANENQKGYQIDLIIDRADHVMNICEIKYSESEYSITKDYTLHVRERMAAFRDAMKTRNALKCTFITPFGVKNNEYRKMVDSEVNLDDLFQK
ncbi:MAG: ATP-binding protein [Spirochaetales bacterium]|nr:ATP-binding protein [Candidatus Physcosoma equi]